MMQFMEFHNEILQGYRENFMAMAFEMNIKSPCLPTPTTGIIITGSYSNHHLIML